MAQQNYSDHLDWVLLEGPNSFPFYNFQQNRDKELKRNKDKDPHSTALQDNWKKIKRKLQESSYELIKGHHATISCIDLCKIIDGIPFNQESNSEVDFFFKFLARCPQAAHYVTWLLTGSGEDKVKRLPQVSYTQKEAENFEKLQNAVKEKLKSRLKTYAHSLHLFRALLKHNQNRPINDDLIELAKKYAGGTSALLSFHRQLSRTPPENSVDLAFMPVETEDQKPLPEITFHHAIRAFRYSLSHAKAALKLHPIFLELFPAPSVAQEERQQTAPTLVPASPRQQRAHAESMSLPLRSPTSPKTQPSPNRSETKEQKPALKSAQQQRTKLIKKYILDSSENPSTNAVKDIFYQHPDVFFAFAEHASNEELDSLLKCFPDPLRFLEQARSYPTYKPIIAQRIDQIALHLSSYVNTVNSRSLRNRFDAFFKEDGYVFRTALQGKFDSFAERNSSDTIDEQHKKQLLSMLQSSVIRNQLKLHRRLDLVGNLLNSLKPPKSGDDRDTPYYAIGFELARDQALWDELMLENKSALIIRLKPFAEEFLQNPLAFDLNKVSPPAWRFFFARYLVEKYSVERLIRNALNGPKKLASEVACFIAFDKNLSTDFRALVPEPSFFRQIFDWFRQISNGLRQFFTRRAPEPTLTTSQVLDLNKRLLGKVRYPELCQKTEIYPFQPPKHSAPQKPRPLVASCSVDGNLVRSSPTPTPRRSAGATPKQPRAHLAATPAEGKRSPGAEIKQPSPSALPASHKAPVAFVFSQPSVLAAAAKQADPIQEQTIASPLVEKELQIDPNATVTGIGGSDTLSSDNSDDSPPPRSKIGPDGTPFTPDFHDVPVHNWSSVRLVAPI